MTDEDVKTDVASDAAVAVLPTKEELYAYIPSEWICLFYGKQSLLQRVQATYGIADNDGTRAHLRALVHELKRDGRILCECRTWPDKEEDTNFHHTQCRLSPEDKPDDTTERDTLHNECF
jgi:ferredoxin-thioredoxin reductase catalytic subunit